MVVGASVFGAGGWPNAFVLLAFFVPSVILSQIGKARKRSLIDIGKHGARDATQVFANGGVATVCAMVAMSTSLPWHAAFAGAFAAAAADTWGTEIGTLASAAPRSIFTGKPMPTGLSGGVTIVGTSAEILGAVLVAVAAFGGGVAGFVPVAIGGVCGATVDSILGAALQTLRYCKACQRNCETEPHACGANTYVVRGLPWMSNDVVNFFATGTGALVAGAVAVLLPRI